MFNNQQFYHKHTKKAIIAFGTIFNSINIRRLDSSGNLSQSIRVPLPIRPNRSFFLGLHKYLPQNQGVKLQSHCQEWDLRYLVSTLIPLENYLRFKKLYRSGRIKQQTHIKGRLFLPHMICRWVCTSLRKTKKMRCRL